LPQQRLLAGAEHNRFQAFRALVTEDHPVELDHFAVDVAVGAFADHVRHSDRGRETRGAGVRPAQRDLARAGVDQCVDRRSVDLDVGVEMAVGIALELDRAVADGHAAAARSSGRAVEIDDPVCLRASTRGGSRRAFA
jgi:hypothetical protein